MFDMIFRRNVELSIRNESDTSENVAERELSFSDSTPLSSNCQ